ncbi:hypothetical protein [Roseomonas haemaphysalidis]|jgi:hypothetical protein|uniref:DUF4160 domain-containing protein n=1 Tax=Roseomonas haemaphysalidis TaxID=2768162 RepID=A0ABS3KU59_9PROT|nr:hypothetical protein [Roseomonas haemaphysalidis]MBO1080163.1 hypothetical protein [Roseomonas haemaphysalidis]
MNEPHVHLFYDDGHGCLRRFGTAPLSSYGGTVPAVGDLIVEPGVARGLDRHDAANRIVHTVVARYFISGEAAHVHLVIEDRPGTRLEREILGD